MKNILIAIKKYFTELTTMRCEKCNGVVKHSHSEPCGTNYVEVYKCEDCDTYFV